MLFESNKNRYCTIPEYLEMVREKERVRREEAKKRADKIRATITKKEVKTLDGVIGERILSNPEIKKMAVTLVGSLIYCKEVLAQETKRISNAEAMQKFDSKGWELLGYLRTFGFWLCLIMCLIEVLKALAKGDSKDITRIVIKYLLGYGSLYLIPWLFELIALLFK
jgi:hypothetical protein